MKHLNINAEGVVEVSNQVEEGYIIKLVINYPGKLNPLFESMERPTKNFNPINQIRFTLWMKKNLRKFDTCILINQ